MPSWPFETRTVSVEEVVAAVGFEDSVDFVDSEEVARGPEPVEAPIARTPDDVSRRKTTVLSSEWLSTWDRTLDAVSPDPDTCSAFAVAVVASPAH